MPEEKRNEIIEDMRKLDNNHSPQLGIFWYNPEADELFGVNATDSDIIPFSANGRKTYRKLHKDIWQREFHKATAKGKQPIFTGDYTQPPRGRIFQYEDGHFEIMVGDWIDEYPNVVDLIMLEFDLPKDNTIVVKDSHWNIGHGWSDEII